MPGGDRRRAGVDVYLFPAMVGGGLGDIVETRVAGEWLARAGFPVRLYRGSGRPLPEGVGPLFRGSRVERPRTLRSHRPRALTVGPMWGVNAAPPSPGPFGRPGTWAPESAEIEAAYGARATVHVSLEEFARTLTAAEENRERYREGGRRRGAGRGTAAAEIATFRSLYRRFRGFDRATVLHLFGSFRPAARFSREYPEAVVTGPLWPNSPRVRPRSAPRREWIWYASPSTSVRLAAGILRGLAPARPPVRLTVREARRTPGWPAGIFRAPSPSIAGGRWARRFGAAELRIVTGSRTLLEALDADGPFLYFNGVTGRGPSRRRHRPEKIRSLLAAWRAEGRSEALGRDLDRFSRGQDVEAIVRRAATDPGWSAAFPRRWRPVGFPEGYGDQGELLVEIARRWARWTDGASALVASVRALGRPPGYMGRDSLPGPDGER